MKISKKEIAKLDAEEENARVALYFQEQERKAIVANKLSYLFRSIGCSLIFFMLSSLVLFSIGFTSVALFFITKELSAIYVGLILAAMIEVILWEWCVNTYLPKKDGNKNN